MSDAKNRRSINGKLHYETGELKYEGFYSPFKHAPEKFEPMGKGIHYFKNGLIYREGVFQHGGLLEGKEYYPSGRLKFNGRFNDRSKDKRGYYGPTYPIFGKFYDEDGSLIYEGEFQVQHCGTIGYPHVVLPEGFGSLK